MPRRRPSSAQWLQEHHSDPYVRAARADGYRSRAAYKLLELQTVPFSFGKKSSRKPAPLMHAGMTVLDLGAAPGGWMQVAAGLVGKSGRVVAVDLLPIAPLAHTTVIQGDFLEETVLQEIRAAMGDRGRAHVMLSDMAPNMSGVACVDQARGELLAEEAFLFAETVLQPGGSLVLKVFQGASFHTIVARARTCFDRVKILKPRASRDRSAEQYLVGWGFRHPRGHSVSV